MLLILAREGIITGEVARGLILSWDYRGGIEIRTLFPQFSPRIFLRLYQLF